MSSPEATASGVPTLSSGGLAAGQTVGSGRFVLKKVLGQGGMGVVWLAHDLRLSEAVALKFLSPQIAFDTAALSDLRRETLRSRKLSHPNIVRIHDFVETESEPPFISMEYVDGPNLHFLRESRPLKVLSWKFLVPLVRQLCGALAYAHGEKVVHRDLKPANLMLDSSGRLKLADFGLARVTHESITRLNDMTPAAGTVNFMSPQQADGRPAQNSDDIYSLGATLYDLLTSRPPFYQGNIGHQMRHNRPDPMPQRLVDLELTNEIPSEASALVMACLAKEPEHRPASVQAILDFLDATEHHRPAVLVSATVAPPPESSAHLVEAALPAPPESLTPTVPKPPGAAAPDIPVPIHASSSIDPVQPHLASSRKILVRVVVVILLAIVGLSWYWTKYHPPPRPETLPAPDTAEFIQIFNGRDLAGWDGDPRWWTVVDGTIQGRFTQIVGGTQAATMLLFRGMAVDDFELRLSFRPEGGPYDVMYRTQPLTNFGGTGYACVLWPHIPGGVHDVIPNGTRMLSSAAFLSREAMQQNLLTRQRAFHLNQWNELVIVAQGNHVRHVLNGVVTADAKDLDSNPRKSGLLGLAMHLSASSQPHGLRVKNVRLKRLPPAPPSPP